MASGVLHPVPLVSQGTLEWQRRRFHMAAQPFPFASPLTKLKPHPLSRHIQGLKGIGRWCVNVAGD